MSDLLQRALLRLLDTRPVEWFADWANDDTPRPRRAPRRRGLVGALAERQRCCGRRRWACDCIRPCP